MACSWQCHSLFKCFTARAPDSWLLAIPLLLDHSAVYGEKGFLIPHYDSVTHKMRFKASYRSCICIEFLLTNNSSGVHFQKLITNERFQVRFQGTTLIQCVSTFSPYCAIFFSFKLLLLVPYPSLMFSPPAMKIAIKLTLNDDRRDINTNTCSSGTRKACKCFPIQQNE